LSEEVRAELATRLGKDYPMETWSSFGAVHGSIMPGGESAIGFPQPSGGWLLVLHRRTDPKREKPYSLRFADGGKADLLTVGLDRPGPVLICEGLWDAMQAYTDGFPVATTSAGAGTWRDPWCSTFTSRQVCIVYDVDRAGREGSRRVLASLAMAGVSVWDVRLPPSGSPDQKDLSDYRKEHSAQEVRNLVQAALSSPAGLAGSISPEIALASAIDAILNAKGPARLKRREAALLVIGDLTNRGELIRATGGRLFWFETSSCHLHDMDSFPFRTEFIRIYGINPAEPEFRHIFEAVQAAALQKGKQASIYRFCYYDRPSNRLYISAGGGRVLRLDGRDITRVHNGTDGVLFEEGEEQQTIPDDAVEQEITGDPLDAHILGRVNFRRGTGVVLSADQQRLILRVWLLAIFFSELLPAKVLLLFYGEKGSGKTSTLKIILKLLLGPHANVTPLGKEDGFNATVSQEYLLVLDNVDSFCRWIEDRLATVATGQTIRLRKLYTTNQMISFPTRCCLALTARTPRFRRDDVVDRLLILRVDRIERFLRESEWETEIETARTDLWTQILGDLNRVVAFLGQPPVSFANNIRMADWGFLATTIGEALGHGETIRSALEATELDKAHFQLEADDLYEILYEIAHDRPDFEWKAGDLFTELKGRADRCEMEFQVRSPKSLGRILHRLEPALKVMIRFEIQENLHAGQALYLLGPRQEATK